MELANKVIIVTGSTTGIGRSIARQCARQGAQILIHGRDVERARQVAADVGPQAAFFPADLAEPNAAERIVDFAMQRFGRIDGLVNNAARVVRSNLSNTSVELFDHVMAVNVRAPLLLIQAALPHLVESQGCVANIGSVNSLGGEGNLLAYSVSKGALLTLSKNLADVLSVKRVRVCHFNVGWVLTENEYHYKIADGFPADWVEQLTPREIPSGAMTTPDQVAEVVSFWLSDRSRPFSGTVMELEQYPFAGRNKTREKSPSHESLGDKPNADS